LYKVKKGKQERYVKDDAELNQYLLQLALTGAELHVEERSPAISGTALEDLAQSYMSVKSIIARLSRRYDNLFLTSMMKAPVLTEADCKNQAALQSWMDKVAAEMELIKEQGVNYKLEIVKDEDNDGGLAISINRQRHGLDHLGLIPAEFFNSSEFAAINEFCGKLYGLLTESAYIQRGDKRLAITAFEEVMDWLMKEARRGQSIQRYKGLGEMNPDQLWDTTMDPASRRMLQVKIEDVIAADEIFTTLMGDNVEPRREFIEKNALSASNIDV
jgi:DNA gyrase subunit B